MESPYTMLPDQAYLTYYLHSTVDVLQPHDLQEQAAGIILAQSSRLGIGLSTCPERQRGGAGMRL